MKSFDRPPRSGGFVVTVSLLFFATLGVFLLVVWQQRQAAMAQLTMELRQNRLDHELRREVTRLRSASAAGPAAGGSPVRPLSQALLIQALDNLLTRGRNERQALESQRQALLQLSRRSADPTYQREVRQRVRELGPKLHEAKLWVRLLEVQLLETYRQREARSRPASSLSGTPTPPQKGRNVPTPIAPAR